MSTYKIFFKYRSAYTCRLCQRYFRHQHRNMPSEDKIERLATGMPQEQVREILGVSFFGGFS